MSVRVCTDIHRTRFCVCHAKRPHASLLDAFEAPHQGHKCGGRQNQLVMSMPRFVVYIINTSTTCQLFFCFITTSFVAKRTKQNANRKTQNASCELEVWFASCFTKATVCRETPILTPKAFTCLFLLPLPFPGAFRGSLYLFLLPTPENTTKIT